jgi:5-methylthioadenosine/S-adenosylhomocysteine deaminase
MTPTALVSRFILPGPGEDLVEGAWIRLEEGVIREVVRDGRPAPEEALDLGEAVLLPGLVLAHTHVDYGAFAGHGDGSEAPPDFLSGARLSCLQLVAAGVTGVAEATDPGESAASALIESGLRAVCFQEEFAPDPADADRALTRLRAKLDRLEELAAGTRVSVGVSPHAPYTLSEGLFAAMVEEARTRSMGVSIHVAETDDEVALIRDGTGPMADGLRARGIPVEARGASPYGYLRERGWLDGPGPVLLVHGVQLEPEDLEDLAGLDHAWLVHCPRSNARLGEGIAPIAAARDLGVRWLLGTDGACSADRLDPFEEVRAAVYLARAGTRRAGAMRAEEPLEALWRGHEALGFGPGRITEGAPADLCALDLTDPALAVGPPEASALLPERRVPAGGPGRGAGGRPRLASTRRGLPGGRSPLAPTNPWATPRPSPRGCRTPRRPAP